MTAALSTSTTSLTFVRVGGMRVAIPSARVDRVRSESERDDGIVGSERIDLAEFLGFPATATDESSVLLSLTGVSATLVATMPLIVTDVPANAIHPVPDYFANWARLRGITEVVLDHGELTYLLDADAFERGRDELLPTGTSA